jgi:hypothetical protein
VPLIAHPRGSYRADRGGREQAPREIEDLALSVLGGLALQDDGARLTKLGRVTERRRADDLGQQIDFGLGIVVTAEGTLK